MYLKVDIISICSWGNSYFHLFTLHTVQVGFDSVIASKALFSIGALFLHWIIYLSDAFRIIYRITLITPVPMNFLLWVLWAEILRNSITLVCSALDTFTTIFTIDRRRTIKVIRWTATICDSILKIKSESFFYQVLFSPINNDDEEISTNCCRFQWVWLNKFDINKRNA